MLGVCPNAHPQGEAALPFLLISSSADANAWGGVSTSVASDDAISVITNPGQLGLFTLESYFSASTYTNKTAWLSTFQQSDLTYNAQALAAGYNLCNDLPLPFPISLGVGYSEVDLDLGTFIMTGPGGPDPIGTFEAYEKSNNISIAFGIEYFLRLGVGWNFKDVESVLGPLSSGEVGKAQASMSDFGLLLQAPMVEILERATSDSIQFLSNIKPYFTLSLGSAVNNMGDDAVSYSDLAQADPLPKNAITGLSLELGFSKKAGVAEWKVLTFTLAREAEDLLVKRSADGSFEYQSGWGEISFFKNVIGGKAADCVNLHRGWQLNVCEFVYLRGGSYAETKQCGNRNYSTSGFTLRLSGLFRLLEQTAPDVLGDDVVSFVADHIDIVYDHAEYSDHELLGGTSFNALSIIVR